MPKNSISRTGKNATGNLYHNVEQIGPIAVYLALREDQTINSGSGTVILEKEGIEMEEPFERRFRQEDGKEIGAG
jgi:hypothetical protein